jgi:hypothetical protein
MEKITKIPCPQRLDRRHRPQGQRQLTDKDACALRKELDELDDIITSISRRKNWIKKVLGERTQPSNRRSNLWSPEELQKAQKDPEYSRCVAFRALYDPRAKREWIVIERISEEALALVTPPLTDA